MGKLLLLVGAVGLIGSLFGMLKIKSLEGQNGAEVWAAGDEVNRRGLQCAGMGDHAVRHAPYSERRRTHRPRIGRHWRESVRDHRRFAGGLQQERGLEELEAPDFITAAKIIMERKE